ncbi:hypothetical protein pb186bvf_004704 [Paramecium bursaria]
MGSAQQSKPLFVQKNLANLNTGQNQEKEFVGHNHIENIYNQISDNRQGDFLKFAKDLELVKSTENQDQYEDNFDNIFNLDDKQLKEKMNNEYKIKQSEVYIILDERAKFIQSAKRHDDKQFTINFITQQREDLNNEIKTILFIGEKQTGITSFANCVINCLNGIELRSPIRHQFKDSMFCNIRINKRGIFEKIKLEHIQIIDFPGIDNEQDLDQQLIKLYQTIHEIKITAVCFIAQNEDDRSQMVQKKVLKHFNKNDQDKIFIIRTFSDFGPLENGKSFQQFQSQSTSFFLESQKNPINMVNMKKTMNNILQLSEKIFQIEQHIDTQIIQQTIIMNQRLKYIDEQQLLCTELLKIIEKSIKQYARQEANANQNGEIQKWNLLKNQLNRNQKKMKKQLNAINVSSLVQRQGKKQLTQEDAYLLLKIYVVYVIVTLDYTFFQIAILQNISRAVTKQYVDEAKKSQFDHYSNQAEKSKISQEVIQLFFQNMVNNYNLILLQEKQVAQQKLQQNLFSEIVAIEQSKLEYIKIDYIQSNINQALKIFIDQKSSQNMGLEIQSISLSMIYSWRNSKRQY